MTANLKDLLAKYLPKIIEYLSKWLATPDAVEVIKTTPIDAVEVIKPVLRTLHLKRLSDEDDGIFSLLTDEDGQIEMYTVEHSYADKPKLTNGTWVVKLGEHQLDHGGKQTLYCIQNLPGHSGLCIHKGNYNKDSDGCICVGEAISTVAGIKMVTNSDATFEKFMKIMNSVESFNLVVS